MVPSLAVPGRQGRNCDRRHRSRLCGSGKWAAALLRSGEVSRTAQTKRQNDVVLARDEFCTEVSGHQLRGHRGCSRSRERGWIGLSRLYLVGSLAKVTCLQRGIPQSGLFLPQSSIYAPDPFRLPIGPSYPFPSLPALCGSIGPSVSSVQPAPQDCPAEIRISRQ
jgi:hypothetical protein